MSYFYITCQGDSVIADMLRRKAQLDAVPSTSENDGNILSTSHVATNEDQTSGLATIKSDYENLPLHLKICFEYCCTCIRYSAEKGKLVRLLSAEGLIRGNSVDIMEDIAANTIAELIGMGLLKERLDRGRGEVRISSLHHQLAVIKAEQQDFVANFSNSPLRMVIMADDKGITPSFKALSVISLSVITAEIPGSSRFAYKRSSSLSGASMETICGFQCLLVLDLDGEIEYLPKEVGDLVHLKYLGMENSKLNELPSTIGNLQKLQTLDIRMCWKLHHLPIEVLNIQSLRHLLMSRCINDREIIVPKGIGMLTNLYTCTGVYAGGGIASELSTLTQLRELGVKRFGEDHASELYAAISKMANLISLSLEGEESFFYNEEDHFSAFLPDIELFSPPPFLQELYLHGGIFEMPIWLASMTNLTSLTLSYSDLQEIPTSVLQFLPKLKHLTLWKAYKGKQIGKDFCQSGGFAELQTLTISSSLLVEWTEIVKGAFPKLKSLDFRCFNLRFLPEGLQNISTLEELSLIPMHEDLGWRLTNDENYKIRHIPTLSACYRQTFSGIYVGNPNDVLAHA